MHHRKQRFPRSRLPDRSSSEIRHRALVASTAALLALAVSGSAWALPPQPAARASWEMPPTMPAAAPALQPAPAAPATKVAPMGAAPASYQGYAYAPYPVGPPPGGAYGYGYDEPADEPAEEEVDSWFFDLTATALLPLSVGGLAGFELPGRLLLQAEVGWMPPIYGSIVNSIVQGSAGYGDQVGSLVDDALNDGLVLRLSGGWRPFSDHGFEITGGYTSIALSGSVSPAEVAAVAGGDFAANVADQMLTEDVTISSQLHNFHVALGWRWVAFEHLLIRASIGYTQTLASSTTIETPQLPEAGREATAQLDPTFDEAYRTYSKMPLLGIGAGYRF